MKQKLFLRKTSYMQWSLSFLLFFSLFFTSCKDQMIEDNSSNNLTEDNISGINTFPSKEVLSSNFKESNLNVRSSNSNVNSFTKKNLAAGFFTDESQVDQLIPDPKLKDFLNENFEIVVADSIYKVTSRGVLIANIKDADKLRKVTENQLSQFRRVDNNTLILGNVSLYESFKNVDTEQNVEENVKVASPIAVRSGNVPYSSFETVGIDKWTVVGKIIQKWFGVDKEYHTYLGDKLRLTAAVFAYDYRFMAAAGFKGAMQNKTWIRTWPTKKSWGYPQTIEFEKVIFSFPNKDPRPLKIFNYDYKLIYERGNEIVEAYRDISEEKAIDRLKNSNYKFHTIITPGQIYSKQKGYEKTTTNPVNVYYLNEIPFKINTEYEYGDSELTALIKTIKATFGNSDLFKIHVVDAYVYTLGEGDGKYYGFHFLRNE